MPEQGAFKGTPGFSHVRRLTAEWFKERARQQFMTEAAINLGYDEAVARAVHDYDGPIFDHRGDWE